MITWLGRRPLFELLHSLDDAAHDLPLFFCQRLVFRGAFFRRGLGVQATIAAEQPEGQG